MMDLTFGCGTILLEKYRVERVLGRGGMSVVLKVTHLHLGKEFALKILLPEAAATLDVAARFLREAQTLVRLRGEHVARVFDVGMLQAGIPYMVMEYLRGLDLASELHRRTTLAPGEAVNYVLQACQALAECHAHGIIHRDIKSANLFLTTRPDGTRLVKILDFGISKVLCDVTGVVTCANILMGTPGYMSPEQLKATKHVDARTDIWALGVVLYELLSGRRPFEGETFSSVIVAATTKPPPPMDPRIPRGLQSVVLRCLEKDRRARFSSIAELAAELAPFARHHRAAAVTVDRANLMAKHPSGGMATLQGVGPSPASAPPSGNADIVRTTTPRRRYAVAGAVSLLTSMAVSAALKVGCTGSTQTLDVAATPAPAASIDVDEKMQKIGSCTQLQTARNWEGLEHCASAVDALGFEDEARAFHAVARREAVNELRARDVQQAIRGHDLRKALMLLREIDDRSVYYSSLTDAFREIERPASDEARRKAQGLANAHDCAALKRYVAALDSTSTARVADAVRFVTCVDKTPALGYTAASTLAGGSPGDRSGAE